MSDAPDFTTLRVGDQVLLNGTIFTARDQAHLFLLSNDFPLLRGGIVFHCGPIVKQDVVISAGPTTSARLNRYTPEMIRKYGLKAIIGKGGMDRSVLEALRGRAVYFAAVGGAALLYADRMRVKDVHHLEFGMPEAIWELEVHDFPVIVAMDSNGHSIYEDVEAHSRQAFNGLTR